VTLTWPAPEHGEELSCPPPVNIPFFWLSFVKRMKIGMKNSIKLAKRTTDKTGSR